MTKTPSHELEDAWTEIPAVRWALENQKKIGYYALLFLLLLIAAYRFLSGHAEQKERDFIALSNAVQSLAEPGKLEESLQEAAAILKRHPELNARYDGVIAQALITAGKPDEAKPYAERTLHIEREITPAPFLNYSQNTLLIADGNYREALENALKLKGETKEPTLYLFNLIRIALLQKELAMKQEEQASWQEIESIKNGTHAIKISPAEAERILSHYEMQGTTLKEFTHK